MNPARLQNRIFRLWLQMAGWEERRSYRFSGNHETLRLPLQVSKQSTTTPNRSIWYGPTRAVHARFSYVCFWFWSIVHATELLGRCLHLVRAWLALWWFQSIFCGCSCSWTCEPWAKDHPSPSAPHLGFQNWFPAQHFSRFWPSHIFSP